MEIVRCLAAAVLGLVLVGCAGTASAPTSGEKAALAPTGKLRVGLYLGNPMSAVRDAGTQQLKGVGLDLGRELARRLEVPFEPVVYPSVGALLDAAKSRQWDVSLFQISPARAREFDFTGPLVQVELGYLVPAGSRMAAAASADTPGLRIAVQDKGQGDVILSGKLKSATLVRVAGLAAAAELARAGKIDAIASVKPSLFELTPQLPGSRVLEGGFAVEYIALALPKGREAGFAYARRFVEEARAAGELKAAVERAEIRGAVVPPR